MALLDTREGAWINRCRMSDSSGGAGDGMAGCAEALAKARRLLVITGAGISAESGMPTYRGPDGGYVLNPALPEVMSADGFARDRLGVWMRIDEMRSLAVGAQPNSAHRILAKWEHEPRFGGYLIATQNIDGLHQRAGSQRVSELHGSLWQMARPREVDFADDPGFSEDLELMAHPEMREEVLQRWSEVNQQQIWEDRAVPFARIPPYTGAEVRPNILLFDEGYGSRLLWVEDFIDGVPDAVLVIGCSGGVTILNCLLRRSRAANPGCEIISINPFDDCIEMAHRHLAMPASAALELLDAAIDSLRFHSTGGSASNGRL